MIKKKQETANRQEQTVSGPRPLEKEKKLLTILRHQHKHNGVRKQLERKKQKGVFAILYQTQKEVHAGGSGPVCSALVNFGYIYDELKKKKLKKVLLVATGALFSPTTVHQGEDIYSIAHAISLEVV